MQLRSTTAALNSRTPYKMLLLHHRLFICCLVWLGLLVVSCHASPDSTPSSHDDNAHLLPADAAELLGLPNSQAGFVEYAQMASQPYTVTYNNRSMLSTLR